MGKLLISEERQNYIMELFKNSNIKFTNYQKELLGKFMERPDLIKIETEYPIVKDMIQQLKIEKKGEFVDTSVKKEIKDKYLKVRVTKTYKKKLMEFCKKHDIKNLSTLIVGALNKYMEDIENGKK